jgi:hypothetical protein
MVRYKRTRAETKRGLREAARRWMRDLVTEQQRPDVREFLEGVATDLIDIIKSEYARKALGGTDDAGIKWEPTQKFPENKYMMIVTGDLLNSFKFRFTPKGFTIYTDIDYAKYALGKRPAWPKGPFPVRWVNRLLETITPRLKKYIEKRIRQDERLLKKRR